MKKLEKLFYKFLWNGGPDRIKRTIVIKDLQAGGLRMINVQYFIKALKITWLRRVIKNYEIFFFVLRFYGPVNPMGSCRARSVYLTTRLLDRLSPLSG